MGGVQLLDVNIGAALAGHESDLVRNGRSCCVTVLRADLQRTLLDAATGAPPPGAPTATLRAGAAVTGVDVAPDGSSATLRLADGTTTGGARGAPLYPHKRWNIRATQQRTLLP